MLGEIMAIVVVGQVNVRGSLEMVGYNDRARDGTVLLHYVRIGQRGREYLASVHSRISVDDPELPEAVKKSLEDRQIGVSGKPRVVKRDRRPVHGARRRYGRR